MTGGLWLEILNGRVPFVRLGRAWCCVGLGERSRN